MKVQWIGKNVDLQLLSNFVEAFFIERNFETVKTRNSSDFKVHASLLTESLIVEVKIVGCSNDFTVELVPKSYSEGFIKTGLMTLPFGGGSLILKGLKFQEKFKRLEKDFWVYIEKTICGCANSFHS
jgi:hypothetical protein